MFFGPGLAKVFASKWNALWWAAAVLFLAWCLTPDPQDAKADTAQAQQDQQAAAAVQQALGPQDQ